MTYHSVCNKSSTIFTTCGAAPADPSGAPKFIPGFSEIRVARSSVFCVMFCRSLFVYPSTITVSDYPFVIFYDYGFWLPLCYLLRLQFLITSLVFYGNVLSVRLWLRFLITRLVSYGHCVICPSRITVSEYPFVIFWLPLCYLLITPLVSSNLSYILYLWYIKECQITFWCRFNKLF